MIPTIPAAMRSCSPGRGLCAQGPANGWHLYILDVEGTRLIAVPLSYERTPKADLELARNIIDTLDIDP